MASGLSQRLSGFGGGGQGAAAVGAGLPRQERICLGSGQEESAQGSLPAVGLLWGAGAAGAAGTPDLAPGAARLGVGRQHSLHPETQA